MTLPKGLLEALADGIALEIEATALGHCVRVDHLSGDDCIALCRALRGRAVGFQAAVLAERTGGDPTINSEEAVEIRNRKTTRLCLLVPSALAESSNSSLGNAFASYDLEVDIRQYVNATLAKLPEPVHTLAQSAIAAQTGPTRPSNEDVAGYLAIVHDSPTLETAGRELARLCLVPDLDPEGAVGRLAENARCARLLVRPTRPQTTADERLTALGLRPGSLRDQLHRFLQGKSLRDWRAWLPQLSSSEHSGLSFHLWSLDTDEPSDLERIELDPFFGPDGTVERWSGLSQPNGPGTEPFASVGPQGKVTLRWKSIPRKPVGLARWRLRLVSAEDERLHPERGSADLPELTFAASRKSGSIPLDLELDTIDVRSVRVEVAGLDEFQSELRDHNSDRIVALSDEFWLDDRGTTVEPEPVTSRRDTVPNLPLGRIKAAIELRPDSLDAGPGTWTERDLAYYSVTLNGRRASAVATSPTLRALEERVLRDPSSPGSFAAAISAASTIDPDWGIEELGVSDLRGLKSLDSFLARRRDTFKAIRGGDDGGLVETVAWTTELTATVRAYARAYRALIAESGSGPSATAAALAVDTLQLRIETGLTTERAVVVFPTHPLRLLWYAAYAALLTAWEEPLLVAGDSRGTLLDLALLERVTPVNVPAFMPWGREVFPFTGNLRFFWGIGTPVSAASGRLAAMVAGVLGLPDAEIALADVPPSSIARELRSYLDLHPYVQSLRLRVENIGSGEFTAETLRLLYSSVDGDDPETRQPVPRLDLTAEMQPPVPPELMPLSRLRSEVYMARPVGRHSALNPHFAYRLRSRKAGVGTKMLPQNVTMTIDGFAPRIAATYETDADSGSFYGLLVRFSPSYESSQDGAVWTHRINLPRRSNRQVHPVQPNLTGELSDVHREMLLAWGRLLGGAAGSVPSVVVTVGPDERGEISRVHALSDWVLTLDRFLGPELFDDPSDADLSRVARTYLLDYGPEFLEGLGHRLMVTTSQRAEVVSILTKAMRELGFDLVEESVGDVLSYLKMVSGRLALRVVGNDAHAREAVSLGVVAAYLKAKRQLDNAILVPVDSHPELFGPAARQGKEPRSRCDLLRVRFVAGRMECSFIEVKSRSAAAHSDELMNRIVDQIEATESVVRDLFFRHEPARLDRTLQRSRLAAILRFYLARSRRYALVQDDQAYSQLAASIDKLESGIPEMRVERVGFVVNLHGPSQEPVRLRDTTIRFLNASDLASAGFSSVIPGPVDGSTATLPDEGPHTHAEDRSDGGRNADSGEGVRPEQDTTLSGDVWPDSPDDAYRPSDGDPAGAPRSPLDEADGIEPEVESVPEEPQDVPTSRGVRIALGTRVGDGDVISWTPSVRGSPHLFVLGIPGQGKSWTIARLLDGLLAQGVPSVVFDFHGQFAGDGGLRRSSGQPVVRAVEGLPFSPFETEAGGVGAGESWKTGSFAIAEILQYVGDLGDIQRDLVYQAVRDSYAANGFGQTSGDKAIPTVGQVRDRIEELEQERGVRNVAARLRPILDFGLFRDANATSAFDDLVKGGCIVDVHDLGLETLQLAAGAFLMRRLYKEMFSWGEASQLRLALVLDEAHRLARDVTLPKLMKEGRKFGILVIVASQGLADFHPDVVGNAGTKVIFRTNFPMSKKVAGYLRASRGLDLAAVVEQLEVGEAYVQTPEMATAARVRMYPIAGSDEA